MIIEIVSALIILIVIVYWWSISTYDYWQSRNVTGPEPLPLVGNFKDVLLGKKSFGRWLDDFYAQYPSEKFIGVFIRRQPLLIVKDLDILKDIFIRDFSKFPDRGLKTFEHAEPLSQHLVNLEHTKWRPLRHKLSPAFTSGKLKEMFYLLEESGDKFRAYVEKMAAQDQGILEVRDLTARFTTDVIGTCAFGLQLNAMADEESEFRKMGKYVFHIDWKKLIRFRIREGAPWLYRLLAPIMHDSKVTHFFTSIMKDTIAYRRANKVVKHDFIDLIMELQDNPEKIEIKLTDTLLTSQLFVFFLAGFETSSTTMSNALYELAQHHADQDRLRDEIKMAVEQNGGKLSYELVKGLKFMDMVFKETLRKYPPATFLVRRADTSYTFSNTDVTIRKDIRVMIPVMAIHRDPAIYQDPEKFDPERFSDEEVAKRHPMSFLAFGDGPRNCIGARFANHQTKVGLIKILQDFRVDICEKTEIPYEVNPRSFLLAPKNGIYLKFSKI